MTTERTVQDKIMANRGAEIKRLRRMLEVQPHCGHARVCITSSDEGTSHCAWCESLAAAEAREQELIVAAEKFSDSHYTTQYGVGLGGDGWPGDTWQEFKDALRGARRGSHAALDTLLAKARRDGVEKGRTICLLPCGHLQQDSDDDNCWTCGWIAEARRDEREYIIRCLWEVIGHPDITHLSKAIRALPLEQGDTGED